MKIITCDSSASDMVHSKQKTRNWYIKSRQLMVGDKMKDVSIN